MQELNDESQLKIEKAGLFSKMFTKSKKAEDTDTEYPPSLVKIRYRINEIISKPLTLQVLLFLFTSLLMIFFFYSQQNQESENLRKSIKNFDLLSFRLCIVHSNLDLNSSQHSDGMSKSVIVSGISYKIFNNFDYYQQQVNLIMTMNFQAILCLKKGKQKSKNQL